MHYMKLKPKPFYMIKSGQKHFELRLLDEKRRKIKIGDKITFTNTENGEEICRLVVGLHQFSNFQELYNSLPLLKCGYTQEDVAFASYKDMEEYYSKEEQSQYGVVGIELAISDI